MTMADDLLKKSLRSETIILVAEREPVSLSSLSDLLREEGYQVLEASESISAIHQIDNHKALGVILVDFGIPGWNSLIRHAHTVLPQAFILCMVAPFFVADVAEAQRLGACAYFLKPLDFLDLHHAIRKLLTATRP
jgi:DNA-binding response OmpR family regulator